jgi:predicted GNAT family N-acyltransferase
MRSGSLSYLRIVLGPWERVGAEARGIRFAVFILEQGVPAEIELDDYDAVSLHAIAYAQNGTPVATGRLLPDGHIGRIAVLRQARGAGVGGQILDALIEQGHRQGHHRLVLHAQTHAQRFYEGRGFAAQGKEFMEAGIAHVVMTHVAK